VPTYDKSITFLNSYKKLKVGERANFKTAVAKFVEDLKRDGIVRASLGIRPFKGAEGVLEFHFEGDGRALFEYGDPIRPDEKHVLWLNIGTHAVYDK
jgi:hypothetical protein